MARRKKDDLADAVVDITAFFPWWIGLALAISSYFWLHAITLRPLAATTQPGQISSFAVSAIWHAFAFIGQYLLPFLFLLGAGMSAYKRYQAKQLHADASNRADGIAQMSWREFELLVSEYFRLQGFAVTHNGGGGPDGGVDVWLHKGSDRYLVQCKHWRARRVGVELVREMYGVVAAQRLAGGFVVTSGDFTEEARAFAAGRELQLVNGKALQSGIHAQAEPVTRQSVPVAASAASPRSASASIMEVSEVPICPLCHASMTLRQARSGANAGRSFWGCSQYGQTKCRGTRELLS
jgi:restriction system protein